MKIFKLSVLFFLYIQCGKQSGKSQPEPEMVLADGGPFPCNMGPKIYVDTIFKDYESEIVHYHDTAYFVKHTPSLKFKTGFLFPCNLPQKFRVDGLKVKVSGNLLSNGMIYPRSADPFQLVSIELNQ
jgi:hypothetical protein